jgi:hypothetical protein
VADLDRFCAFAERFLTDESSRPLVIEPWQREILATTSPAPAKRLSRNSTFSCDIAYAVSRAATRRNGRTPTSREAGFE